MGGVRSFGGLWCMKLVTDEEVSRTLRRRLSLVPPPPGPRRAQGPGGVAFLPWSALLRLRASAEPPALGPPRQPRNPATSPLSPLMSPLTTGSGPKMRHSPN